MLADGPKVVGQQRSDLPLAGLLRLYTTDASPRLGSGSLPSRSHQAQKRWRSYRTKARAPRTLDAYRDAWHGSVDIEEGKGLVVRLGTSKGSQTQVAQVVVPCEDMPDVCEVMERWVKLAAIPAGRGDFSADRQGPDHPTGPPLGAQRRQHRQGSHSRAGAIPRRDGGRGRRIGAAVLGPLHARRLRDNGRSRRHAVLSHHAAHAAQVARNGWRATLGKGRSGRTRAFRVLWKRGDDQ